MIILDTNVLSEVLRPEPDLRVVAWLENFPENSLYTTAITRGEILYGVRLLPEGQRKTQLFLAICAIFDENFADKILSFDSDAADVYANLAAKRRALGMPISQFDAQIAAIAKIKNAVLATRNVRDFVHCDIEIVNPWL